MAAPPILPIIIVFDRLDPTKNLYMQLKQYTLCKIQSFERIWVIIIMIINHLVSTGNAEKFSPGPFPLVFEVDQKVYLKSLTNGKSLKFAYSKQLSRGHELILSLFQIVTCTILNALFSVLLSLLLPPLPYPDKRYKSI